MPSWLSTSCAGLLHDLGARIVVLVDAVAEAHQPERVVLVLGPRDVLRNVLDLADFAEHLERRLVGAAVRRAPQAGDAGGDAGERVGAGRAGEAHRRGRGVLLVVGVQNENPVERARHDGIDAEVLARNAEAHAQEVGAIAEIVLGIHERLADRIFVGHRRERRHLGDHAHRSDLALARIVDVDGVVIEGRQRADAGHHDRHRMRVTAEAVEEPRHLLVDHGVAADAVVELRLLRGGRQLAVQQHVAGLEEVAVFGELVDRVAAIEQYAGVAVDVGDLRLRCSPSR